MADSNDELIESYVDRAKFSGDTVFIEAELKKVATLFDGLSNTKIQLSAATSLKDISSAAELGIKTNVRLVESVKAVDNVIKQRFATEAKLATLQTDYTKQTAASTVEIQKQTKETKALAAAESAALGSRERAAAQIKVLTIQKDKLNLVNAEEKKSYDEIVAKIEKYNSFLVKTGTIREKQAANVGNYQGSAKIIVDALEKEKKKLEELEKTRIRVQNAGSPPIRGFAGGNSSNIQATAGGGSYSNIGSQAASADKSVEQLNEEIAKSRTIIEGFARVTEQPKFLNVAGKLGDANQELRFFTKALIDMERQGQGNSEAANALRKNLAQLTDQISDAKAEVKALSSDTRGFDLFAGSVTFAADAFQTFAGAAVLAGASEKDAAEATKTLVAVQSVANGVKGIANELTTRGTAANKIYAFSQQQIATAMDTSAAAGIRLKAILLTIGFGALIVGIGLLVANFSKIKDAFTGATVATKAYSETLDDYKKGAQEAIEKTNKVGLAFKEAKEGVIKKDEALKIYNKTLGETFGKAKSLAEAEKLYNAKAGVYIEIMGLKAQANALFAKSAEEAAKGLVAANEDQTSFFSKIKSAVQSSVGSYSGAIKTLSNAQRQGVKDAQELTKANEEALKAKGTELATKADQLAKTFAITVDPPDKKEKKKKPDDSAIKDALEAEKRKNAAIRQLAIENANEIIRINQQVTDSDTASLKDKIGAIQNISDQRKTIAAIELNAAVEGETKIEKGKRVVIEKSNEEKLLAITQFNNKEKAINDETLKSQIDAQKAQTEKLKAEYEKQRQAKLDALETDTQAIRDKNDKEYNESIIALNNRFNNGLISQDKYNKEREKIDTAYQIASLVTEIAYQKKLVELSTLLPTEKAAALQKLHDLEKQLSDASLANFKKNEAEKLAALQKTLTTIQDVSGQVFGFIGGLLSANADTQKNKLKEQQDEQEKKAAREIELVNASTLKEEEKASKIIVINARLQAQKDANARKEKKINEDQAKFAKAVAIFNIILSTTQAVIKAYTEGDPYTKIARAILAGVAGAAQLAVAIATPIPKYFKGKGAGDNYEGPAIVGDGGKSEVIQRTDGTIEFTPAKDTLTHIGRHDIIHPDKDAWLNAILNAAHRDALAGMRFSPAKNEVNPVIQLMEKQNKILNRIADKKETTIHANEGAVIALHKWGQRQINYVNENTNW